MIASLKGFIAHHLTLLQHELEFYHIEADHAQKTQPVSSWWW